MKISASSPASLIWTIARVKVAGRETLPEKYQEFVVLCNGASIGTVKWVYRPKVAGGPAWRAKLTGVAECGMDVNFYHSDKKKVLEWVKSDYPARKARQLSRSSS